MSGVNIMSALAKLYYGVSNEVSTVIASGKIAYNDVQLKEKIRWLGDISKTLSLVYQIEKLRSKEQTNPDIPEVKDTEDPVLKNVDKGSAPDPLGPGWSPF